MEGEERGWRDKEEERKMDSEKSERGDRGWDGKRNGEDGRRKRGERVRMGGEWMGFTPSFPASVLPFPSLTLFPLTFLHSSLSIHPFPFPTPVLMPIYTLSNSLDPSVCPIYTPSHSQHPSVYPIYTPSQSPIYTSPSHLSTPLPILSRHPLPLPLFTHTLRLSPIHPLAIKFSIIPSLSPLYTRSLFIRHHHLLRCQNL